MKAITKTKPEPGIEVRDVPVPELMAGYTLLKVKACGICGSDVHIYEWTPGYESMTPYMPLILGHEFSGEVVEVGEDATDLEIGDRVFVGPPKTRTRLRLKRPPLTGPFARGGMAEYALVSNNSLWELPETISYEVGAMCEPLSIAMNAVRISEIVPGENAVVLGPGPIGLLTLLSLKAAGAFVLITGKATDDKRLKLAKKIGADVTINVDEEDPVPTIVKSTGGGADVVYEATGVPATIQQGLDMVRRGGKVVAIGIHPGPASINMLDLVRRSKQILGSYAGPISVWTRELALLTRGIIKPEPIITQKLPLSEAKKGFELASSKQGVKILFTP